MDKEEKSIKFSIFRRNNLAIFLEICGIIILLSPWMNIVLKIVDNIPGIYFLLIFFVFTPMFLITGMWLSFFKMKKESEPDLFTWIGFWLGVLFIDFWIAIVLSLLFMPQGMGVPRSELFLPWLLFGTIGFAFFEIHFIQSIIKKEHLPNLLRWVGFWLGLLYIFLWMIIVELLRLNHVF